MWVCWKLWREIEATRAERAHPQRDKPAQNKNLFQAAVQIVSADVSISLDNVLAVAGAARHHPWLMVFGLVLSVGLMGVAANLIAGILKRYFWVNYVGLAIILYVALKMIWDGAFQVANALESVSLM